MASKKLTGAPVAARSKQSGAPLPWPKSLRRTRTREQWHDRFSSCPVGLSLDKLAELFGEPYASVAFWTKTMGYAFVARKRGRKSGIDWNGVDWTKKNCDLARQLGVTGERVRQVRQAKGLPPAMRLSEAAQRFQRFLLDNPGVKLSLSIREMIGASGAKISVTTAHTILKRVDSAKRKPPQRGNWNGSGAAV